LINRIGSASSIGGVSDSHTGKENIIMENLLDLANQDETQRPEAVVTEVITHTPVEVESETVDAPELIEEIDTAPKAQVAKALPGKAVTKPASYKREEPPPNPLLLDPYE